MKSITKIFTLIVISVLFCVMPATADAITYQDIIDEISNNGKAALYNINLNAPFEKDKTGITETINPENGQLYVNYELFTLKGRGEVGYALSVSYCNSFAAKGVEMVEYNQSLSKYINKVEQKDKFEQAIEGIGTGWRINIPYVEGVGERNKSCIYVHLPDGTVYLRNSNEESGLDKYLLKDMRFEECEHKIGEETAAYMLAYANGDIYYFSKYGYVIAKLDKYGNQVQFAWSEDDVPLLTGIFDNCGNSVSISYTDELVKMSCSGRTYEIYREISDGAKLVRYITDPLGRKTEFCYEEKSHSFNFRLSNHADIVNTYYLLNSVTYSTGLITKYEYITSKKWLYEKNNGHIEYSKISKRYDIDESGIVNYKSYSYYLEPDGYPTYKSDTLPYDYVYSSTETDLGNSDTSYFYDKDHDQIKTVRTVNGKVRGEEIRQYDKHLRLPQKFTVNAYDESGECRSIYTETVFDELGNITRTDSYTSPADKGRDVREYKYSSVGNLCIYESFMQDENTKIEIVRTVAPGGFGIASETLKENGREIKRDEYEYYANGNLHKSDIQTGLNNRLVTRYTYSGQYSGRYPTEVTVSGIKTADGADGSYTTYYDYDRFGNVTKQTDSDGNIKSYVYDLADRLVKETLEDGKTREYKYDDRQNTIHTVDANNKNLLYSYDKYGKIKKVEDADNFDVLLRRSYDSEKRLICETDASGTNTKYSYDSFSRYTSAVTYDAFGAVLSEKHLSYDDAFCDADGTWLLKVTVTEGDAVERRTVSYLFDRNENAVEKRLISGDSDRIYRYQYDNAGNNILAVSPLGNATKTEYDIFGNPTLVISPDGLEQHFEYDYAGNCIREINGEGGEIIREFDSLSRQIREETSNGEEISATRFYYDGRNNLILQYDPKGNKTEFEYDSRGFLTCAKQFSNGVEGIITEYEYDGEGNITKTAYGGIGTSERHIYENVLDSFGRPVKSIDSLGNASLYEYDVAGNLIKQTDPNGNITEYSYNGLGLVTEQINSQEGTITYEYNSFGEPISVADGDETKLITYNGFGEVIKEEQPFVTNTYEYDEDGNIIKHTIADRDMDEQVTEYEYNGSGLVTAIKTGMGTEYITYDNAGRIREKENQTTGLSKFYLYYPDNNIKEIRTRMDGKLVYYENFAYDKNGNKVYDDQNGSIKKYSYDGLNRLTGAEIGNIRTEYEFDNYNNISKEYEIVGTHISKKSYYYDNANRLLFEDGTNTTLYEYDNAGNLIKKITGIGSNTETAYYRYDGYNRLSEYIDNYTTSEYDYNIDGLRASKTVNGTKTRYVYNQENIIGEIFDDNIYTYFRGTELIGYTSNKGDRYYYRQNSHGDVTALLTIDATEKKTYAYNAYGKENPFTINPMGEQTILFQWRAETENTHNPFRYCGEYQDSETGLIYLRNRYYDPSIGRFISKDTHWNPNNMIYGDKEYKDGETKIPDMNAIMQSNNLYAYCMNNPMKFVDPSGMLAYPGQIHNLVVNKIASTYGLYKEQTINYTFGWGRADLISSNGAVWDVKRDKPNQILNGVKQVNKYVSNQWKNNPNTDLYVGGYIDPGSFVVTLNVDTYYVNYHYAQNGVIAYDYYKVTNWEQVGEYAKNALGVVIIAGCSYAIYQSGGILAPVLVPVAQKATGGY